MAKKKDIVELTRNYWDTALQENKDMMFEYLETATELSEKTLKQYTSALKVYVCYLNKHCQNIHLTEVKARDFRKYLNFLLKCGILEDGIKMKRSPISMLNEYIILYYEDEYPTFRNYVTKAIKTPDTEKKFEKQPLTEEEFENLCSYLEEHEEWQKLAYFKFTYSTGCRRNESRQLLKEVVDYEPISKKIKLKDEEGKEYDAEVKKYKTNLIKTKGKKSREKVRLSFDEEAMYYLKKWLEVRGEDDCSYMFVTNKANPHQVGEDAFWYWCKCLEPVVGRRFHPHMLRSSRATNLAISGKKIEAIAKLLNHKDTATTKIYICKEDDEDEDEIFAD